MYQVRFTPLMNPVALAPAGEPSLPDLFHLQTRSACPEVFTRNERRSPGPQVGTGRPLGMRRECVVKLPHFGGIRHPFPFRLRLGLAVPSPLGSPARQVKRTDLSVLSGSLCSPQFIVCVQALQPLSHRLLLPLASLALFHQFPLIRGGVPTVTVTTDTLSIYTCVLVVQWAGSFKRIPRQAAKCWWAEQWSQMGPKSDYAPKELLEGSSGEK